MRIAEVLSYLDERIAAAETLDRRRWPGVRRMIIRLRRSRRDLGRVARGYDEGPDLDRFIVHGE